MKTVTILLSLAALALSIQLTTSPSVASEQLANCKYLFFLKPLSAEKFTEMLSAEELEAREADMKIDAALGFDFRSTEKILEDREYKSDSKSLQRGLKSKLGYAKWSEGNTYHGWQTNYRDLANLFTLLKLKPDQKVIDIGSGYGRPGFVIGLLFPKTQYLGYEIVSERINIAKQVAAQNGFRNVTFKKQDLSASDFQIEPADVYYMYDPINDKTMRSTMKNIIRANEGRPFSIILHRGGPGDYEKIISEHAEKVEEITEMGGDYYYKNAYVLFKSKKVD
ncbi:MAG: hypothetical protein A4S09_11875 [Proteobacteria bacterium SG_bin7]|nr:MAG: hypothetical protein A4S09_11875 [Proteobacteria bacterium SG_bin7]